MDLYINEGNMITAGQLRAARALVGIDRRELAALSGLAVPTIQRMEASDGVIRGTVDSLVKLITALDAAGVELIAEGTTSLTGGRGVRLKLPRTNVEWRRARRSTGPRVA
jgi:transcriptional regulator with XRE-family HTH domain